MTLIKEFFVDRMEVRVYSGREKMGQAAAKDAIEYLKHLLEQKDEVNIIFAAAPSQNEFLSKLTENKSIDWARVNALHLDEYIGLPLNSGKRFSQFLYDNVFNKVNLNNVYVMNFSGSETKTELARYEEILKQNPIDIAFIGIGENGHIAFNDPGVADFNDPLLIKEVKLDLECRQQQVNDGCFAILDDVPKTAATVTIPVIMSAKRIFCMVPAETKAQAVKNTIYNEVNEECPATALRNHENIVLYLEGDSAKFI